MMEQKAKVIIIDYGMGNLFSIQRMMRHLGINVLISDDPGQILSANYLVLPGVGAFGDGMANLKARKLIEPIVTFINSDRPFLGICLGMQLLMDSSEEFGFHQGLGIMHGSVKKISEPLAKGKFFKIPHIGWSQIHLPTHLKGKNNTHNTSEYWNASILNGLPEGEFTYFVHSFIVIPQVEENILAESEYGNDRFCSVLRQKNIFGTQFHPEVSGKTGLYILKEFLKLQ